MSVDWASARDRARGVASSAGRGVASWLGKARARIHDATAGSSGAWTVNVVNYDTGAPMGAFGVEATSARDAEDKAVAKAERDGLYVKAAEADSGSTVLVQARGRSPKRRSRPAARRAG